MDGLGCVSYRGRIPCRYGTRQEDGGGIHALDPGGFDWPKGRFKKENHTPLCTKGAWEALSGGSTANPRDAASGLFYKRAVELNGAGRAKAVAELGTGPRLNIVFDLFPKALVVANFVAL